MKNLQAKIVNKQEIIDKLRELKPELEQKYFVKEVGLFGSYVRNEQREDSDIDILVDYGKDATLFVFGELQYMLSELFDKKVDIAMKKTLKKRIGKQILSEVIYV